jgi:hypothetical protein
MRIPSHHPGLHGRYRRFVLAVDVHITHKILNLGEIKLEIPEGFIGAFKAIPAQVFLQVETRGTQSHHIRKSVAIPIEHLWFCALQRRLIDYLAG